MRLEEITLPITEPETEWVRGRPLRKVSPRRDHARLQLVLGAALDRWARGRGEVGTEWRFRVPVPGEPIRPLVPDIAFVEKTRLAPLEYEELQAPVLAPDVAIEILSPGEDPRDTASKVEVYLRAGTKLVAIVDGDARTVTLHDSIGASVLFEADTFEHPALPDFCLQLRDFFTEALAR